MAKSIRKRVQVFFTDEVSITDQSMKNAVDVNSIVASISKGQMPSNLIKNPSYGDISSIQNLTLADSIKHVSSVQSAFDTLPVEIKALVS